MSGELVFPLSTAPGINPLESGGRLINAVAEKAPAGSRSKVIYRRAAGLIEALTVTGTDFRGGLQVGSILYVVNGDKAFSITKNATTGVYTVTELTGDPIGGEGLVMMDRNMNAAPQVLIWHSDGISEINTGAGTVADFSDADLPSINSLCFVGGYFVTSAGNGQMNSSGLNAKTFGANDKATAEQSPDGLRRVIRYGRDLAAMGQSTIEFWGNVGNPTGFPFSFSSVTQIGILVATAVSGFELGFPGPVVFVANDRTVHVLNGYGSQKISTPDLEALIEAVTDVTTLEMTTYVAKGRRYAALSCDAWTWVYCFPEADAPGGWSERKSYGEANWRARFCLNAFDEWLAVDRATNKIFRIGATTQKEATDPLVLELRSAQIHAFPSRLEIDRIALDFLVGVGVDAGQDPIETDPKVLISWSMDGGRTFGNEIERRLGSQGEMVTVDVNRLGTTGTRGCQIRVRISDPVNIGLLGGAWEGRVIG